METSDISHSAGSDATGYDLMYAFDGSLGTYWKPSSTGTQNIDLDLGEARQVDNFAVFVHDYDTNYNSGAIQVRGATNSGFTSGVSTMGTVSWAKGAGTSLYLPFSSPTGASRRYWQIALSSMSNIAEIAGFFLLRERDIGYTILPATETDRYLNAQSQAAGGHRYVHGRSRNKIQTISYQWYLTATTLETLQSAFEDSKGSRFPVVLYDGSTYRLARIVSDLPAVTEDYDHIRANVQFETLVYPEDGYAY
jgi:hypothetical protein